ncbi:hypothetical protein ACLOJK_000984 [Asimina triloba]
MLRIEGETVVDDFCLKLLDRGRGERGRNENTTMIIEGGQEDNDDDRRSSGRKTDNCGDRGGWERKRDNREEEGGEINFWRREDGCHFR